MLTPGNSTGYWNARNNPILDLSSIPLANMNYRLTGPTMSLTDMINQVDNKASFGSLSAHYKLKENRVLQGDYNFIVDSTCLYEKFEYLC